MSEIDLSKLPAPDVLENTSFEDILSEMVDDLKQLDPELTIVESEPSYKILQVAAYREMTRRQRDNERVKGLLAAYAKGPELDHIGVTYYNTPRLTITPAEPDAQPPVEAVMESDEDYLKRFLLSPDGWSTAGPSNAYKYHALSADPDVLDAVPSTPEPMKVVVTILSRTGNGQASSELIDKVLEALSADEVRPQTDLVTVSSAQIVEYQVSAQLTIEAGPDPEIVRAEAESSVSKFIAEQRKIGNTVVRDALLSSLYVEGVRRVTLNLTGDVVCNQSSAAHCTSIEVGIS